MTIVVDASALIALLRNETGHEIVARDALGGKISAVNMCEVNSRLVDLGDGPDDRLVALTLDVIPFDEARASAAALLRRTTAAFGLSLGDRACLALAIEHKLPVLTADRIWAKLDLGVEIRLIR